ncbi:MAG: hypothetical protein WCE44_07655 [Candidatus Velthaea sp.]|jgi:hypothetical protein
MTIASTEGTLFPTVSGHNLNGRLVEIPRDLDGRVNLIFIAFTREQQREVNSWQPFVAELTGRHAGVRAYEFPTLARPYGLMRGFLDGIMRSAIPDEATRDATVTLFIDKRAFDRALGITSEDTIAVFLVKAGGEILWRMAGAYDPVNAAALGALVERTAG